MHVAVLKFEHSLRYKQEADITTHYCAHPDLDPTTSKSNRSSQKSEDEVLVVPDYTC